MTKYHECSDCGRGTFYDKRRCGDCGNDAFRAREAGVGTVRATTTVHVTPDGVDEPLMLGLAVFGDARVIAQLDDDLSVGDSVRLEGEVTLRERGDEQFDGSRLVTVD